MSRQWLWRFLLLATWLIFTHQTIRDVGICYGCLCVIVGLHKILLCAGPSVRVICSCGHIHRALTFRWGQDKTKSGSVHPLTSEFLAWWCAVCHGHRSKRNWCLKASNCAASWQIFSNAVQWVAQPAEPTHAVVVDQRFSGGIMSMDIQVITI